MKSFNKHNMLKHMLKFAFFLVSLLIICLLYLVYKNSLAKNSLSLIEELQLDETKERITFFRFIYGLANKRSYFMSIILMFNF